jgi:sugar/nucleoside kinase (ribokinase family)
MLDLARIKDLKVLVVGDAIMDEYRYVTAIGKAIKENALSLKFERSEEFRGGVWAAASHTAELLSGIGGYDLVIVTDFGHGTMTPELIARVSREARYLAVNAQTNSTNFGFNLITKYPRADFVVLDELEARLAAHDKDSPIEDVILAISAIFKKIIVTMGANGAVGFDGAFERQKATADKVSTPWARATPSSAWPRRSLLPALR